jgi:glutamate-1-semialdehyde 2,1-aminomutase
LKKTPPFPGIVREGNGAHFTDVDGNHFLDFCLGDTGAMAGHAPEAAVEAIAKQTASVLSVGQ